jgi:hypothetical protein
MPPPHICGSTPLAGPKQSRSNTTNEVFSCLPMSLFEAVTETSDFEHLSIFGETTTYK